jgi:Ca2+/Na+ antiporter
MAIGTGCFLGAVLGMFAFAMTQNQIYIYLIGVLTLFYVIVRISISVYVYKDAKALSAHAIEAQARYYNTTNTYSPSAFLWAFSTLISPPFVEYAAMTVYLFRRRQRTGSP